MPHSVKPLHITLCFTCQLLTRIGRVTAAQVHTTYCLRDFRHGFSGCLPQHYRFIVAELPFPSSQQKWWLRQARRTRNRLQLSNKSNTHCKCIWTHLRAVALVIVIDRDLVQHIITSHGSLRPNAALSIPGTQIVFQFVRFVVTYFSAPNRPVLTICITYGVICNQLLIVHLSGKVKKILAHVHQLAFDKLVFNKLYSIYVCVRLSRARDTVDEWRKSNG